MSFRNRLSKLLTELVPRVVVDFDIARRALWLSFSALGPPLRRAPLNQLRKKAKKIKAKCNKRKLPDYNLNWTRPILFKRDSNSRESNEERRKLKEEIAEKENFRYATAHYCILTGECSEFWIRPKIPRLFLKIPDSSVENEHLSFAYFPRRAAFFTF